VTGINDLQRAAATADSTRAEKIVAGAGTGKTLTLVERFAYLVSERGFDPNRIVAVTFTNRAAADLRSRLTDRLVGGGLVADRASMDAAWVGTFHGLCVRLLRDDCYEIGFDRDTAVIDPLEERLLVDQVLISLRNGEIPDAGILDLRALSTEIAMKVSAEAFGFIRGMKGRGIAPDTLATQCTTCAEVYWHDKAGVGVPDQGNEQLAEEEVARLICATYHEYERWLAARRMLDFDGILLRLRDALRDNAAWRQRVRERFQYIIVDEFQDTSRIQRDVLELLAQEDFANVAVVGDPKQSIYGWRDAQIRNLLDFPGEERLLLTNYRSVQPILDLATHLIRKDAQFAAEPDLMADAGGGHVRSVSLYRADTPEDEARFVAGQILRVHGEGTSWDEIALLTRMARPPIAFEQELRKHGIPYVTSGGQGFFDREEIKDVMAYLALVDNPLNDMALIRVLQGRLARVSDGQLHRLLRSAEGDELELRYRWDRVIRAEKGGFTELGDAGTAERVTTALDLVRGLASRRAGLSVGDLVQAVLDETGYAALAGAEAAEAPRRLGNLRKLYRMAGDFEASQAFTGLDEFIRYVNLHDEHEIDVPEADVSGSDAVRFMTVHAAKGLEFPVVFLAHVKPPIIQHRGWLFFDDEMGLIIKDLGDTKNPTLKHGHFLAARAGELPKDVDRAESRRLVYVAITRAERQLFVSATRKKEPDWDSVFSELDGNGRARKDPADDHFRTLALFLRDGGCGTLLDTESGEVLKQPTVASAPIDDKPAAILLPSGAGALARDRSAEAAERLVVSFSQLEVLAQCGLRYRYMFEWRLPAPPDDLRPRGEPAVTGSIGAADLGTLVHAVLERFHQPGVDDGAGGIPRLRVLWNELATVAVGAERAADVWDAAAGRMFERYLKTDIARMHTIATEQEVNLLVNAGDQSVLVRGFIDRLGRDSDGRVWVVDYKTNRSLGAEALTVYGRQLAIYQRAAKEALGLDADAVLVEMRTGAVHRGAGDGWPGVEALLTSLVTGRRSAPSDPPCWGCAYWRSCPSSTRGEAPEVAAKPDRGRPTAT
jgi:DNA helicase-2/ATP-dependent DNA helicase PcrA